MSRVSWLVLFCALFAAGLSSFAQGTPTSSSSATISASQPSNSESPTSQPQQAQQPLPGQPLTPITPSDPLLTPLPAQLPPGMTPGQAEQLLIALWPIIVDWSINSDKLPALANLSLTFLSNSQATVTAQNGSIASGQAASSSAETNAAGSAGAATSAAGSAASAVSESQIESIQAKAAADAKKAAEKPLADAQGRATALGIEIGYLRIGCITLGVCTAGFGVYELGRWQKWWK